MWPGGTGTAPIIDLRCWWPPQVAQVPREPSSPVQHPAESPSQTRAGMPSLSSHARAALSHRCAGCQRLGPGRLRLLRAPRLLFAQSSFFEAGVACSMHQLTAQPALAQSHNYFANASTLLWRRRGAAHAFVASAQPRPCRHHITLSRHHRSTLSSCSILRQHVTLPPSTFAHLTIYVLIHSWRPCGTRPCGTYACDSLQPRCRCLRTP
jgi:hypothetical protein